MKLGPIGCLLRDTARSEWELRGAWLTTGTIGDGPARSVRLAFEAGHAYFEVMPGSPTCDADAVRRALDASGYEARAKVGTMWRWFSGRGDLWHEAKRWSAIMHVPAVPKLPPRAARGVPTSRPRAVDRDLLDALRALPGWRCFAASAERRRDLEGPWTGFWLLASSLSIEDGLDRFHNVDVQFGGGDLERLARIKRALQPHLTKVGLRDTKVPRALKFAFYSSSRLTAVEAARTRRRLDRWFDERFPQEQTKSDSRPTSSRTSVHSRSVSRARR